MSAAHTQDQGNDPHRRDDRDDDRDDEEDQRRRKQYQERGARPKEYPKENQPPKSKRKSKRQSQNESPTEDTVDASPEKAWEKSSQKSPRQSRAESARGLFGESQEAGTDGQEENPTSPTASFREAHDSGSLSPHESLASTKLSFAGSHSSGTASPQGMFYLTALPSAYYQDASPQEIFTSPTMPPHQSRETGTDGSRDFPTSPTGPHRKRKDSTLGASPEGTEEESSPQREPRSSKKSPRVSKTRSRTQPSNETSHQTKPSNDAQRNVRARDSQRRAGRPSRWRWHSVENIFVMFPRQVPFRSPPHILSQMSEGCLYGHAIWTAKPEDQKDSKLSPGLMTEKDDDVESSYNGERPDDDERADNDERADGNERESSESEFHFLEVQGHAALDLPPAPTEAPLEGQARAVAQTRARRAAQKQAAAQAPPDLGVQGIAVDKIWTELAEREERDERLWIPTESFVRKGAPDHRGPADHQIHFIPTGDSHADCVADSTTQATSTEHTGSSPLESQLGQQNLQSVDPLTQPSQVASNVILNNTNKNMSAQLPLPPIPKDPANKPNPHSPSQNLTAKQQRSPTGRADSSSHVSLPPVALNPVGKPVLNASTQKLPAQPSLPPIPRHLADETLSSSSADDPAVKQPSSLSTSKKTGGDGSSCSNQKGNNSQSPPSPPPPAPSAEQRAVGT